MPAVETPGMQLRIFCICGQKMKVSSTMFGRPGKCIACRQKIRIPRMDEIPPDVTAIYLKDHPEFLRKPAAPPQFSEVGRAQAASTEPETGDDAEDVSLGDAAPDGPAIPLEPLHPLQVLCSLEEKVQRQIEQLKKSAGPANSHDKATLVRYRTLIRNARSAFDDQLRLHLVEGTEQLSGVRESIARANMSLRVGELSHEAYVEKVRPLRQQRDRLERRLQNVRGWLVTSDPAIAGGYLEVRLEDVPVVPEEITFPLEVRTGAALLDQHIEALRAAMRERAAAERKLAEWQRIERERALPTQEIELGRRESEAIRLRAAAAVAFVRGRLEQAVQDSEQDNKAIKSFVDSQRGRVQAAELDAPTFKALETRLLGAQDDNVKARELARRALAANSPADVPRPASTLMQRLAAGENAPANGLGLDSWFSWAAAALMLITIAVPLARQQPGGNLSLAPGLSFGLFMAAGALSMLAVLPSRGLRALLLNVVWTVLCIAGTAYLHETWLSPSPVGAAMRNDAAWFTSPGLILLALCGTVTGLAASVSVVNLRNLLRLPAISAGVILVTLVLILTDVFGVLSARPEITEPTIKASTTRSGMYEVQLDVANAGWRTLVLGGDPRLAVVPATFLLQYRLGPDSWQDYTMNHVVREKLAGQLDGQAGAFPNVSLGGGDSVRVTYLLPPGSYRAEVAMPKHPDRASARNFTLAEIAGAAAPVEAAEAAPSATPEAPVVPAEAAVPSAEESTEAAPAEAPTATVTPAPAAPTGATVELQGVINAAGRDPRFIIILRQPGAEPARNYAALGETVYGKWKAAEFNPGPETLTLSDGERLMVLERGAVVDVGVASPTPVAETVTPSAQ